MARNTTELSRPEHDHEPSAIHIVAFITIVFIRASRHLRIETFFFCAWAGCKVVLKHEPI
ncbi:unnamed protein product [Absidia cylindrospora]